MVNMYPFGTTIEEPTISEFIANTQTYFLDL